MFIENKDSKTLNWNYKNWIGYRWRDLNDEEFNKCGCVESRLIETINLASAHIHKKKLRGGANVIMLHPDLKRIISTLLCYQKINKRELIGSRYSIIYDDSIEKTNIYVIKTDLLDEYSKKNCFGLIKIENFL